MTGCGKGGKGLGKRDTKTRLTKKGGDSEAAMEEVGDVLHHHHLRHLRLTYETR